MFGAKFSEDHEFRDHKVFVVAFCTGGHPIKILTLGATQIACTYSLLHLLGRLPLLLGTCTHLGGGNIFGLNLDLLELSLLRAMLQAQLEPLGPQALSTMSGQHLSQEDDSTLGKA